jgi:4-amino-4-deoxy-L-arabinose transferase-like glycosyltransferase
MVSRDRLAFWGVLSVAAALLLVNVGGVPLLDPDESRFARTSVEMLRSQDLVVPSFEGQPRLVKPPLMHWVQSFLFGLLGTSEWVVRLHAILATFGSLLLVSLIARRRFGDEARFWSVAFMGCMPLVVALGHVGTLDALLAVHILAIIALDIVDDGPFKLRPYAIGGLLGLAFLIKGPVGLLLPLLVMLSGRTLSGRDVWPGWRAMLQGATLCVCVVMPWALAFVGRLGWTEVLALLRTEGFERYYTATVHTQPAWFYLEVAVVGFLPWLAPLSIGLVRAFIHRRDPAAKTAVYAAAGLIAGLVFFSLSKSKLPSYILPLAPLAALLITWEFGQRLKSPVRRSQGTFLLVLTMGTFAVLLGYVALWRLDGELRWIALAGAGIYLVGGLVATTGQIAGRPRVVYGSAAATGALFMMVLMLFLMPYLSRTKTSAYLITAVPELTVERPLAVVEMKVPSLTFYLDRVPEQLKMAELGPRLAEQDDPLIVFDEVDLAAAPATVLALLTEVGRQGKYIVYEKRN